MRKVTLLLCCYLLMVQPAFATDVLDISTALKTLLLMNDKPSGAIVVAVVFDPAAPASKADAAAIKNNIDNGAGVPSGLNITAKLVETSALGNLSGAKVALLASDLPAGSFSAVSAAANALGVLTVSTDLACVKSGKCVLGIVSKPRVEILYNAAAADAAHISFANTFLMLVEHI